MKEANKIVTVVGIILIFIVLFLTVYFLKSESLKPEPMTEEAVKEVDPIEKVTFHVGGTDYTEVKDFAEEVTVGAIVPCTVNFKTDVTRDMDAVVVMSTDVNEKEPRWDYGEYIKIVLPQED